MTAMTQKDGKARQRVQQGERRDLPIRLLDWLTVALERSRQRRALAALSDYQLKDIGLTRADVGRETAKPFWRA